MRAVRAAPRPLRIGIAQIHITMGDKRANRRAVRAAVTEAAAICCDVVVFPECSLLGWCSPAARAGAETVPGRFTVTLGRLARLHRMAIVIGMEEREGPLVYNSAVMIDREGRILSKHRKINELDVGRRIYSTGTSISAVDFEGRRVGLDICADSWVPEIVDALYRMGTRLIFSPCAWAVHPGGEARNIAKIRRWYAARTKGRDLVIVSSNCTGPVTQGPWRGCVLQGESTVTGPDGRCLLRGPRNRPALLTVDL